MPFVNDIYSPEALFNMAKSIYEIIKTKPGGNDPSVYENRANEICCLMAHTGKMLADAKYHRDLAIKNSILGRLYENDGGKKIPISTLNDLIRSDCMELNYLVNWCEQLDKECKYQLEILRSLISLRKEELKNTNFIQ